MNPNPTTTDIPSEEAPNLPRLEFLPESPDPSAADDILLPFTHFIQEMADYGEQLADPQTGLTMTVDEVKLKLPVEIRISVGDSGQVTLKGSPPTQRTETTFMPVFHQLSLRVTRENGQ